MLQQHTTLLSWLTTRAAPRLPTIPPLGALVGLDAASHPGQSSHLLGTCWGTALWSSPHGCRPCCYGTACTYSQWMQTPSHSTLACRYYTLCLWHEFVVPVVLRAAPSWEQSWNTFFPWVYCSAVQQGFWPVHLCGKNDALPFSPASYWGNWYRTRKGYLCWTTLRVFQQKGEQIDAVSSCLRALSRQATTRDCKFGPCVSAMQNLSPLCYSTCA